MSITSANSVVDRCQSVLSDAWSQWREFWFKPADPLMLGVIRILTGLMLTYNLLVWSLDLRTFFGQESLQPLDAIRSVYQFDYVFSFLFYVPDAWLVPVHWTCILIALLFCFGVGTRVTAALAFLITISYSQRVPVANFGLDQILGMLCLYLAIGPSGQCLSVDSWWRNRKKAKRGLKLPVLKLASARTTLRLIQIHICIIYFWAGFAKLKGDSWWTGEAMWQVIANQEYQTADLTWMAHVPWLPYLLAHVTVAWEVFFCMMVWRPRWRPLMLGVGTMMHIGIGAFLGMWTFGLVMTFPYLAFAKPSRWRRRLVLWPRQEVEEQAELPSPETADALAAESPAGEQPPEIPLHQELQEAESEDELVTTAANEFGLADETNDQRQDTTESVAEASDADSEVEADAGPEFALEPASVVEGLATPETADGDIAADPSDADLVDSGTPTDVPDLVETATLATTPTVAVEEFTTPPQLTETSHAVQTFVSDPLTDGNEISPVAEESMIQPLAATAESTMAENDDTKNDSDESSSTLSVADMLKGLPDPPVIIDRRTNGVAPSVPDEQLTPDGETVVHVIDDDNYMVGATSSQEKDSAERDHVPAEPQIIQPISDTTIPSDNKNSDGPAASEPDTTPFNSGATMTNNAKNTEGKNEISTSRMERIKPKSANSMTGAPPPQVDGHVEDSVLAPESEVLLVALHAPERNTFRTYLRKHDIPCRAAMSAENAVSIVLNMKPAAVLLSGSCMNPEEILTLIDDINDMVDAPVLALLTVSQINHLSNDALSAHVLQYPASLRQVREELSLILMEEGNAKPRCSLRAALANND